MSKREYLQSRLVTTFDREEDRSQATLRSLYISPKKRSLNLNTLTVNSEGNLSVDNSSFRYEEYISSEGLLLDHSYNSKFYRLFNRRQDGLDILDFSNSHPRTASVQVRHRLTLPGRTQFLLKGPKESKGLSCLSAREDGACLYLVDLERLDRLQERAFKEVVIKAYDRVDEYGELFVMSAQDKVYLYDIRNKKPSELVTIDSKLESKFNLIYNTFKEGRMINVVTMFNVLVFDIRNPGECVLKYKHFCDVPPNRHMPAQSVEPEAQADILDALGKPDFEKKVDFYLSSPMEVQDKGLQNSLCLYSCRKNSYPIFLTSYEPYDKQDVENKFNYDIIKEINQTLDPNRLFSQLTRSEVHPQRLFSSNVIDQEKSTNGVSLLYHREKVYYLHLDSDDNLALQVIQRKEKDRSLLFSKILKTDSEYVDASAGRCLTKYVENPRLNRRKKSMAEDQLNPLSDLPDFDSESLALQTIDSDQGCYTSNLDIREKMENLAKGQLDFNMDTKQLELQAEYDNIVGELLDNRTSSYLNIEENNQATEGSASNKQAPFVPNVYNKEDLEESQDFANSSFYLTKQGLLYLKEKY